MNKQARTRVAWETMDILTNGSYVNSRKETISIRPALQYAADNTVLYRPEDFEMVYRQRDQSPAQEPGVIEVTGESTFAAAYRLIVAEKQKDVCCLNFASAKNPGGGFLSGAHAQEEALARASGLYTCLQRKVEMYQINRNDGSCLYTDHMIYSPLVPVFRNDAGKLLDDYYTVSVITAPAVNAGAVKDNEPANVHRIDTVMASRMEKLLSVAVAQGQTTIILGAWGCGVFRNDKAAVAGGFASLLNSDKFRHRFTKIVFAVYDNTTGQETIRTFKNKLTHDL
ncbi:TIGR02452 family protein [Chitinophaga qingshengii]|uniref:TIGR02452 family protein n=1 Tax=Chitinophaga qingshengii TaxID=1569794 RepID=A0ABR7TS06_9BACT|nr:TIGR02452 family protein [Chitinophaga qingshengii]MBC9933263.1 TIGR02452 family protein [Chitinophaga qingshengii]